MFNIGFVVEPPYFQQGISRMLMILRDAWYIAMWVTHFYTDHFLIHAMFCITILYWGVHVTCWYYMGCRQVGEIYLYSSLNNPSTFSRKENAIGSYTTMMRLDLPTVNCLPSKIARFLFLLSDIFINNRKIHIWNWNLAHEQGNYGRVSAELRQIWSTSEADRWDGQCHRWSIKSETTTEQSTFTSVHLKFIQKQIE